MTPDQIKKQSINAYKQHRDIWVKNANTMANYPMRSMDELQLTGIGKAIVAVANGASFEEQIETLKKHKKNVDFVACDKTLGHLLDAGISPTYVVVCDARVNYETYMEKWKDQLQDSILIINVCANPKWAMNGNWKQKYFFVNKDVMGYEKEFIEITKCPNVVTAGTNVSNMMIVLLTQCDNERRRNLMGYDKIILSGFDYCWKMGGNYYAFDKEGGGKTYYMRHIYGLSPSGEMIYTSGNLNTSADWLNDYVSAFRIPVVQCSPWSIATFGKRSDLETNIKYRYRTGDQEAVREAVKRRKHLADEMKKVDDKIKKISADHYFAHLSTV